jgi:hypothetical protein
VVDHVPVDPALQELATVLAAINADHLIIEPDGRSASSRAEPDGRSASSRAEPDGRSASSSAGNAAIDALPSIVGLREQLDRCELLLIESARASGASWTRVAQALGLGSRQAAEQRFLRLCGQSTRDTGTVRTARRGQRSVDATYGPGIARLRAAVRRALGRIELDPGWDRRFPRAALCRDSLAMACDAQPGALFALAEHVLADLAATPAATPVVADVRRQLRQAMSLADSTSD